MSKVQTARVNVRDARGPGGAGGGAGAGGDSGGDAYLSAIKGYMTTYVYTPRAADGIRSAISANGIWAARPASSTGPA